jgi:hypothetical protein
MHTRDFIPAADGKFLEWVRILFVYVRMNMSNWNITEMQLRPVEEQIALYEAAYRRAEDPNRGSADVLAKNEARDTLKASTRAFVREHLTYNSAVTDEDRRRMGLPVHDTHPTPAPDLTTMPIGEVDFSVHQRHKIKVKDSSLTGKGKPPHAHAFEAWGKKGGAAPVADSDFTYVGTSTSTMLVVNYALEDVGTTVWYRFRWVNSRNRPGPWSESTVSAVIA